MPPDQLDSGDDPLVACLQRFAEGDRTVAEAVLREVMPTLRQIASRQLNQEHVYVSVSPTELIHELWLRNLRHGGFVVDNRQHFFAVASRAMRHVLVDMARRRKAARRGDGVRPVSLRAIAAARQPASASPEQVIQINVLVERFDGG